MVVSSFCSSVTGDAFEDAVVAAMDTVDLVVGQMLVLRNLTVVHHSKFPAIRKTAAATSSGERATEVFGDNMADAVADQNLDGDLRIILFLIRKVDKSTGDAVGHLVGCAGVTFSNISVSFPSGEQPLHQIILWISAAVLHGTVFFSRSGKSDTRPD